MHCDRERLHSREQVDSSGRVVRLAGLTWTVTLEKTVHCNSVVQTNRNSALPVYLFLHTSRFAFLCLPCFCDGCSRSDIGHYRCHRSCRGVRGGGYYLLYLQALCRLPSGHQKQLELEGEDYSIATPFPPNLPTHRMIP